MPTKKRAPSRKPTKPTKASRKPTATARSGPKAARAVAKPRKPVKSGASKAAAKAMPAKARASKAPASAAKKATAKPVKAATKPVKAATKPVKAATKPVKAATSSAKRAVKPAKATSGAPKASLQRRDHAGHLDPKYAADLRAIGRAGAELKEGRGFVGQSHSNDALAENLGEMFVETVTTGEYDAEEVLGQEVPEDAGGPFIITRVKTELAPGTDESNPRGAKREPFPTS